jgi:thioredoxin-dependent peroxiredoxin
MTRYAAWRARRTRFCWHELFLGEFDREKYSKGPALTGRRKKSMKNLEGKRAPAFSLDGSDGKKHALEDYKGKTVVLYFYPKDNTPGCTKEACGFRDLTPTMRKSGAVVLGVSKDSVDSHKKFAGGYKLPFTLLSDPKAEVMKKFGAFGKKMMYGKEVQGTIRSTVVIGPKGEVLKHWPTVRKAEAHPEEVSQFLKSF